MKRIELLNSDEMVSLPKLVKIMNEIAIAVNYLMRDPSNMKYQIHQVVWFDEEHIFGTITNAEITETGIPEYEITFVRDNQVVVRKHLTESAFHEYIFGKPMSTVVDKEYAPVVTRGRARKGVTLTNRITGEATHFPNLSQANKFMGKCTTYLHNAKVQGQSSNDKFRWVFD